MLRGNKPATYTYPLPLAPIFLEPGQAKARKPCQRPGVFGVGLWPSAYVVLTRSTRAQQKRGTRYPRKTEKLSSSTFSVLQFQTMPISGRTVDGSVHNPALAVKALTAPKQHQCNSPVIDAHVHTHTHTQPAREVTSYLVEAGVEEPPVCITGKKLRVAASPGFREGTRTSGPSPPAGSRASDTAEDDW